MNTDRHASLIDSHCHLNRIDLEEFDGDIKNVIKMARDNGVEKFLCVCVEPEDVGVIQKLADENNDIYSSVGIHPNTELNLELSTLDLIELAGHPSCIAIGETGLDYYRTETQQSQDNQRERFRRHIETAIATAKPLIIHTRQAAEDTLMILRESGADSIGGVMHCFAEDWEIARQALDLNFYISFSGIVTFKNAKTLHDVAMKVPADRYLIETDSPYLAPTPFRGKQNHPALVKYVAEHLSELRNVDYETIASQSTDNFYRCFKIPRSDDRENK